MSEIDTASHLHELRGTSDGSQTVYSSRFDALYHSHHGALQETRHVFVEAGLAYVLARPQRQVAILELGFGTGLNAAASWVLANLQVDEVKALSINEENPISLDYVGIEAFPLPQNLLQDFHTGDADVDAALQALSASLWPSTTRFDESLQLEKRLARIEEIAEEDRYDCVYHDAFAPQTQPELWTIDVFQRLYRALRPGGIIVTYCAQGQVRRNMQAAGFTVERLPGPPGKRQMMRAHRL